MSRPTSSDPDASEVVALLDRTTPTDLPEVDLGRLSRLHRQRRRRRHASLSGAAAVALVAGIATGVATLGSSGSPDEPPGLETAPAGPNGEVLTEPVGTWRQAADPPFEARTEAFTGALSDGRLLAWGGNDEVEDQPADGAGDVPTGYVDGGIYDPESDTWEEIPAAPVLVPTTGRSDILTTAQVAGDRLAVVTGGSDGSVDAAVYDVAARQWVDAPTVEGIEFNEALGWDGETIVLVETGPADEPITMRWQVGEERWTVGSPFPLGRRNMVGAATDGARIAIWGGTARESVPDEAHDAFGAGAIYDIAADTWTPMAESPLPPGTNAAMWWWQDRLVVSGAVGEDGDPEALPDMAVYDPDRETWGTLPPAPEGGALVWRSRSVEGEQPVVTAETINGCGCVEPRWFFVDGGWEQAPLPGVRRIGGFVVADTDMGGNAGDIPFELQVRAGPDQWLTAAEAPFLNRMSATKVANDDTLLVIGGMEGATLELKADAWVFDVTG